jgi:hypothetical protein
VDGASSYGDEDRSGTVHVFTPGATRYVETQELRSPEPGILEFGSDIAMFGDHVAVAGSAFPVDSESEPDAKVVTYSRIASTLQPLGTTGFGPANFPASIAIANNLLLVGGPFEPEGCAFFGTPCRGRADLFQLNRFRD